MNNSVVYSEQDSILDTTDDNINKNVVFVTTNSVDIPMNANQSLSRDACFEHIAPLTGPTKNNKK